MAKCLFKTTARGYLKDDVHKYILEMSAAAEKEVENARKQTEIYKEEINKLKARLRQKDLEIKELKKKG